jgi:hypothetical protein
MADFNRFSRRSHGNFEASATYSLHLDPSMKSARIGGIVLIFLGTIGLLAYGLLRYIALTPYLQRGGERESLDHKYTARSLAIIEHPYFGSEHRYYRFELRQGPDNNGEFGVLLREVVMEPLPGQPFLMPRGAPAFLITWRDDSEVTFSAQGLELTLRP